jgi:hypothetical protein
MTDDRPEMPDSLTGGCMCGAVRYISAVPIAAGLCHCNRCRPQSGSAFGRVLSDFEVVLDPLSAKPDSPIATIRDIAPPDPMAAVFS